MDKSNLRKNLPILISLLLLVLSFFILKDILVAIISAYILAFLIRPVYLKLSKNIPKRLASLLSVLIVLLMIIIPIVLIVGTTFNQLSEFVNSTSPSNLVKNITNDTFLQNLNLPFDITQKFISLLVSFLQNAISYIPIAAVYILIIIFGTYYFLIDWEKILLEIKKHNLLINQEKTIAKISSSTKEIVYGTFLIAFIELIFAGIAFWILGINLAFLFATIIAIFAFIPGLGPLIVWIPLAVYLFLQASYLKMAIVIVIGLILSIYIDGILRAQITGKKSKIHPFIMLLGILGGISVFGIFGFIIGPIILITTLQLLDDLLTTKK